MTEKLRCLVTDIRSPAIQKLHPILRRLDVEEADLVDFFLENDDSELCRIFESHFTDPKCPKHNLQQVFIANVFVPLDPRDP